jgi:ribosomal protein S18 acetylase RimI-like enzyme
MTSNIEIIPCDFNNPLHCAALVNLMNEYITDKMGDGIPYNEEQKFQLVEGLRNHPSKIVLLAWSGDGFIGLITSFINFATFTVKPYVNIHDLIVINAWRNKGVGRRMIERVIEIAEEKGCSKVTLEVRDDNHNARHLYNSLGFNNSEPKGYYLTKYLPA